MDETMPAQVDIEASEVPVMNPREALFGFVGWLTSGGSARCFDFRDDPGRAAGLIAEFSDVNKLVEVSESWPKNLIHPSGECSG